MREYEHMKLKAELNHRNANSASAESSDASHAELASTAARAAQGTVWVPALLASSFN